MPSVISEYTAHEGPAGLTGNVMSRCGLPSKSKLPVPITIAIFVIRPILNLKLYYHLFLKKPERYVEPFKLNYLLWSYWICINKV